MNYAFLFTSTRSCNFWTNLSKLPLMKSGLANISFHFAWFLFTIIPTSLSLSITDVIVLLKLFLENHPLSSLSTSTATFISSTSNLVFKIWSPRCGTNTICSFVEKVLLLVVLKVLYSDTCLDKEKKLVKWNQWTSDIF